MKTESMYNQLYTISKCMLKDKMSNCVDSWYCKLIQVNRNHVLKQTCTHHYQYHLILYNLVQCQPRSVILSDSIYTLKVTYIHGPSH